MKTALLAHPEPREAIELRDSLAPSRHGEMRIEEVLGRIARARTHATCALKRRQVVQAYQRLVRDRALTILDDILVTAARLTAIHQ